MNWKEGQKYKTKGGHPAMFVREDSDGFLLFYHYGDIVDIFYHDCEGRTTTCTATPNVLPEEYTEPKEIVGYVNVFKSGMVCCESYDEAKDTSFDVLSTYKITHIEGQEPKIERVG